ncbi:hypothetical protein MTO96_004314 [Rhipicephalus appendiculatus]
MTATARDDEQRTLLLLLFVVRRDGCRTALLLLPPCSAAAASAGGHPARSTTAATATSCHDVFWRTDYERRPTPLRERRPREIGDAVAAGRLSLSLTRQAGGAPAELHE